MSPWLEGIKETLFPSRVDGNAERRQSVRVKRRIAVVWKAGGQDVQAAVIDLSAGGMCLECRGTVRRGDELAIGCMSVLGGTIRQPVRCQVRWVRPHEKTGQFRLGVAFLEPPESLKCSWVQGFLREGPPVAVAAGFRQRRRHRRLPCRIATEVWSEWGEKIIDGKVTDLSLGGAGLELAEKAARGMALELRIGPFEDLGVLQVMTKVLGVREVTVETRRGPQRRYAHGVDFGDLPAAPRRLLVRFLRVLEKQAERR